MKLCGNIQYGEEMRISFACQGQIIQPSGHENDMRTNKLRGENEKGLSVDK